MAEKDNGDDLNLELPSFGRKKRRRKDDQSETGIPETSSAETVAEPTVVLPAVDDPTDTLPTQDAPDRFAPPPSTEPSAPHEPAPAPYVAPETLAPETLGAADTATQPEAPLPPVASHEPERPAGVRAEKPAKAPKPPKAPKTPKPERPARELSLPAVNGMTASVFTGALIGVLACGATYLGLLGCQELRGTSACGTPGFFLLVAILIVLVLLGKLILKAFRVIEPGSTSFLGVGVMAVITLAFLIDVVFEWWMIIVIPVVTALAFAGSHWLTARFTDPADDGSVQQ